VVGIDTGICVDIADAARLTECVHPEGDDGSTERRTEERKCEGSAVMNRAERPHSASLSSRGG
jgi:hypothetical protein